MPTEGGAAAGSEPTLPADREGTTGHSVAAEASLLAARRYQAGAEVARGGAGRIVRATDLALDREVALKEPLDPSHGARLQAEARLLARLQHPSIVPVYDTGTRADGVPFFAMKLVDGASLRDVIRGMATHEARLALVPVVIAVAEAVAFAHSRGVLHRDLKPGNVLVGTYGETIVIDWGLAKYDPATLATTVVGGEHTVTGAVMGTPSYMAPEQARGEVVDVRADVYALGAMLYEVLAGAAPYSDRAAGSVLDAVRAGLPTPIATLQPRTPRDLVAIVRKAMARIPAERYAAAKQFADDLRRFQTGRLVAARRYSLATRASRWLRKRWAPVALVAVVAGAGAVLAVRPSAAAELCERSAEPVQAAWTPARRAELRAAFARTGVGYAATTADAVIRALDDHAARLASARIAACAATRVRGEQSEALLDVRMRCLDQRLDQLVAVVATLRTVTSQGIENAPNVTGALDDVAACGDLERLSTVPPEPLDLATRAKLTVVRARLAPLRAAVLLYKERGLLGDAETLARDAGQLGYCPVTVRALAVDAIAHARQAANKEAVTAAVGKLREAARAADACGDDAQRASMLVKVAEYGVLVEAPDVDAILAEAESAGRRAGDPDTRGAVTSVLAAQASRRGDLDRAIELATAALALAPDDPTPRLSLAKHYFRKGRLDLALAQAQAGVAALIAQSGEGHPTVADAYQLIAGIQGERGDAPAALDAAQRALVLDEAAYPEGHRQILKARGMVIVAEMRARHIARAKGMLEQLLPVVRRVFGPDHDFVITLLTNLASCESELGHLDQALAGAREVLSIRLRVLGPDHPRTAFSHSVVGKYLYEQGHHADALAELREGLRVEVKALDPTSSELADTRMLIAAALVSIHRPAEAVPLLELARASYEKLDDAQALSDIELRLARALWDSHGDRARARALAQAAHDRSKGELAKQAEAWLASHR